MKAAVFHGKGEPLRYEEKPVPSIGPADLLVKVAGCGVCQSDMEYVDLGVPTAKKPPLILGHEAAGTVVKAGAAVTGLKVGDPVLLGNIISCGDCVNCRSGRDNTCSNWLMLGNHVDGAFAEYIRVPARNAYLLPPEIPPEDGCIIADALSTPFHAVRNRSGLRPGDVVAVFGCGGLGLNCVQIASASGGNVIAVDFPLPVGGPSGKTKLEMARELGAAATVDAGLKAEVVPEIKRLSGGGVDIAFEMIGRPETIAQALAALRPGGRLVVVGYSPDKATFDPGRLMVKELSVVGSCSCPSADLPKVIDLVRRKVIALAPLITSKYSLSEINQAMESMRRRQCVRNVIVP